LSFHTLKLIWFLTLNKILLSQCLIRNLKMAISEQGKHISKCQIKYAVWHISHYKNRTTLNRWRLSKSLWPHISYVTFHTSFIFIRKTWKIRKKITLEKLCCPFNSFAIAKCQLVKKNFLYKYYAILYYNNQHLSTLVIPNLIYQILVTFETSHLASHVAT